MTTHRSMLLFLCALAIAFVLVACISPELDAPLIAKVLAVALLPGMALWRRPQRHVFLGWIAWIIVLGVVAIGQSDLRDDFAVSDPVLGLLLFLIAFHAWGAFFVLALEVVPRSRLTEAMARQRRSR